MTMALAMMLTLCSCGNTNCGNTNLSAENVGEGSEETKKFDMDYVSSDYRYASRHFVEYRDVETGVHYITIYSNGISMCPRYNADGTLYVD